MKTESVKSAAELLKKAGELTAAAVETMEQGKDIPAETLAEIQRMSQAAQTMLDENRLPEKGRAKPRGSLLRRLAGAAICAGAVLYFVPELRQDIMANVEWLSKEWRRGK